MFFNKLFKPQQIRSYATRRFRIGIPSDPDIALGFGSSMIAAVLVSILAYDYYKSKNFVSIYAADERKAADIPPNSTVAKQDQIKQQ